MYQYYYGREKRYKDLFDGIEVQEGVVLQGDDSSKIFIVHGHQVDLLNSELWRLARFLVRYLWTPLESIGVKDPTRTAKNHDKKRNVERQLTEWVKREGCIIVSGHTHRPMLPELEEVPYINSGSCVHPRCITAVEIVNSKITLVKWAVKTKIDGTLYIAREILAGPNKITDHYENGHQYCISSCKNS